MSTQLQLTLCQTRVKIEDILCLEWEIRRRSLPVEWHHGTTKQEPRRFLQFDITRSCRDCFTLDESNLYNLFDAEEEFEVWSGAISSTTTSSTPIAAATTFAAPTSALKTQTPNDDGLSTRKGFLSNISCGKIVNTSSLINARETHQIRGAALDVMG